MTKISLIAKPSKLHHLPSMTSNAKTLREIGSYFLSSKTAKPSLSSTLPANVHIQIRTINSWIRFEKTSKTKACKFLPFHAISFQVKSHGQKSKSENLSTKITMSSFLSLRRLKLTERTPTQFIAG